MAVCSLRLDQDSQLNQGTGSGDPEHGGTRARDGELKEHCSGSGTRPGYALGGGGIEARLR